MDCKRRFRFALAEFATGVCVVTASTPEGERVGATMNSFNSVSMDPPLVLFSVARNARSLSVFEQAQAYGINVLSRSQSLVSNRFARSGTDKWKGVATTEGLGGAPLLTGALAHFECRPHAIHDGGDHRIFIAEVVDLTVSQEQLDPLIFFRGGYRDIGPEAAEASIWPLPIHY